MGTKAGVGISRHRHWKSAAKEAIEQAQSELGSDRADFVLMFASVAYPQDRLVKEVRSLAGNTMLAGCSSNGVITHGVADEGNFHLGIMMLASDELRFDVAIGSGLKDRSFEVGEQLGRELAPHVGEDAQCCIVLADGLTCNFDQLTSGMTVGLSPDTRLPLFGGMAGDNWQMKTTYQYANDQVVEDGVACVVMSGPVKTAWSVNHGCMPLGEELTITKAEGNAILELDGKPALEVMREYLNPDEVKDWGKVVVNLGLGFKASEDMQDYDDYLIRFMPAKDDTTGAVSLPTEVTVGTPVWMTRRDKQKIATGIEHIADDITAQLKGSPPKFVLQFDCAGRGKMVFREQEKLDLLDDLQRRVGPDVPWLGVYTYGEIGPVGKTDCFHNYTLVLLAIQ